MRQWYIIYTSGIGSRGVTNVQSMLDRLGFENMMLWSPTMKRQILRYGKLQNDIHSIFSSYVFLNAEEFIDSSMEQALIENKIGRFLKHPGGDMPAKISEEDIAHIKSLEEIEVEPVPQEIVAIEVGNLVEICVGPFMGVKGVVTQVDGHNVYIETLLFSRSSQVRINAAHLSKLMENYSDETDSTNTK